MPEKKQVLVICRTPAGQMYLSVLLNRMWYSAALVKTAAEAAKAAVEKAFSVIILDGDMPDEELYSYISDLKSNSLLKNIPLLVFISKERYPLQEMLVARGCSAVLTKPLDIAIVYGVLSRLSGQPRSTPRVPVRMQVSVLAGDIQTSYMSVNISEGGVYLRSPAPMPEKTEVEVSFILPMDTERLSVKGEIVRTTPLASEMNAEPGMGIRFIAPSEDVTQRIRNFVQWELMGDLEWDAGI